MNNQVSTHLKWCNPAVRRVIPDQTTVLQDHICTRRLARRRAQVIQAYRDSQINLQPGFYIKVLNTNDRVQRSENFKTEFAIQYGNYERRYTVSSTSCPLMWCQPARTSRGKRGPLDGPPKRKRLSNPGRTDLLEVSGNTTCSWGLQQQPWVY